MADRTRFVIVIVLLMIAGSHLGAHHSNSMGPFAFANVDGWSQSLAPSKITSSGSIIIIIDGIRYRATLEQPSLWYHE